ADGSYLAAGSAAAEELIAAIGLEARHHCSRRHLQPLEDLARLMIDPPQIALITFPGAVPQLAVDPGDAGDEAAALDGAKHRAGFRIDLSDSPRPMLAHPQSAFGPGEPRAAAVGRRDRGQHAAGLGVDLLNAVG